MQIKPKNKPPQSGRSKWLSMLCLLSLGYMIFVSNSLEAQNLAFSTFKNNNPSEQRSKKLSEFLNELGDTYQIKFVYESGLVDDKVVLESVGAEASEEKQNKSLEERLAEVLKPYQLTYEKVYDNYYIIQRIKDKEEANNLIQKIIDSQAEESGKPDNLAVQQISPQLNAQIKVLEQTISGKVTDENNEGIPGVNIVVKNTSKGTVTDISGNYRLTVSDDASTLVFSSVGYSSEEVEIGGRSVINVQMLPDIQSLSEVVVIGYGTQDKRDVTGAISSVEASEFEGEPISNITQGLQGKVAGVNITSGSGAPGGNMLVRIRGNSSVLGSNDPLYVIDGVPIQASTEGSTNLLSTLNSGDIASIEVLKDASATSIYGSRGSNGVILITTKQGKSGKNLIEFETSMGVREITRQLEMLNSREFAQIANDRNINDGLDPIFNEIDTLANINTDWQDEIFRSGIIQNHTLRFSGGNEKTKFSVSGNYFDEEGIIIGSDFKRGSLRMNLDQELTDKFNLSSRLFISRSVNNEVSDNSILQSALQAPPFFPVKYEDGTYVSGPTLKQFPFSPSTSDNPVAEAVEQLNKRRFDRVLGNVTGSYELMEGLNFNVLLGVDHVGTKRDLYTPRILEAGLPSGNGTKGYFSNTSFLNENTINYDKQIGENDNLNITAGFTWQTEARESLVSSSSGFVNDDLQNEILGAGESFSAPETEYSDWTLISWLARVNYSLNDKYLFTISGRADGSSRFGENNKWGYFPSGAFAWRASDENFIRDNFSQISNLKLRTSYGFSGNQAITPYQTLQQFQDVNMTFGEAPATGFAATNLGNPDLKWETTREFNVGLELGLWEHRLWLNADYYVKNTDDLLAIVNIPPTSGFTSSIQNIGSTRNEGVELQIGADLIRGTNLNWDLSVNASHNSNTVTETAGGQDIIVRAVDINGSANIVREGEPLGAFYGLKTDGLTEDGMFNYVDDNGDGEVNGEDRVILGSPYADLFYGMSTNVSYKNLSLRVSLQGELGKTLWNNNRYLFMNSFHRGANQLKEVFYERWTPQNPDPNAPYPKSTSGLNQEPSDWYLEDASYLRVQNIMLNYSLPVSRLNISALSSASVYLSAQNLITITGYSWYTPDVNNFGTGDLRIGIDQRTYPAARTITLGLKIGL
ncbi:TonB-linked SusC/RagA family outer membrane protein [Catalinimonas alkaloidigena]|uniref:SusC/RagA family TonB-linked outer membrane protein n=1 Tax=Catalinimonas alkaloidigena TaxID=1075417 RepID=UPI0024075D83|nr:TonB-dependent receptor [Catalinimonas alkaloidigena]MDF9796575.1 TonB-linked SusC/RagA family outer membrane protein [Catalinimonas alkaloidigena]